VPTYEELASRCESLEVGYIEVENDLKEVPTSKWNKGVLGGLKIKGYALFVNYATFKALTNDSECLLLEWNMRNLSLIPVTIIARYIQKKRVLWWGHGESKKPSIFTRFTLAMGKRLPNAVIVYMDNTREQLVLSEGYKEGRTYVARNGVDVRGIISESKLAGDLRGKVTWVTAYSGRLVGGRDLDRIIYAIAELTNRGVECKHYFIGDGEYRQYLENLAASLNIKNRIVFCGAVHKTSSLAKVYADVDFVIIPGWLGLVINQAYAFAKPVIICDNQTLHNPEISLFNNSRGWVYSYEEINLVEVYLTVVKLGKSKVSMIGQGCQELIVNEYSTQKMVDGLQEAVEGGH